MSSRRTTEADLVRFGEAPHPSPRGGSPKRRSSQAFTLVELLVVVGIASIVLLGLGVLYCTSMRGIAGAAAEMAATDQATTAFADLESSVRNAVVCDTVTLNGVTALRCKLPSVGVDLNGDGVPESYAPATLDKFGREQYVAGTRVWYYLSDATGVFGTVGTILWRANVATDANPTSASRDLAWTLQDGQASAPRFTLIAAFAPTVDATNDLVTLDLTAASADYAVHQSATGDTTSQRRGIRLLAQTFWRHWRT